MALVRTLLETSGGRLVGMWWALIVLVNLIDLLMPGSFADPFAEVALLVLIAGWFGYPLFLFFCTPDSKRTAAERATVLFVVLLLVALSVLSVRVSEDAQPFIAAFGFALNIFLMCAGAHVLGRAEHRLGFYRPLDSLFAVLSMFFWPVAGMYVHNRLRRVAMAQPR